MSFIKSLEDLMPDNNNKMTHISLDSSNNIRNWINKSNQIRLNNAKNKCANNLENIINYYN